ncbi:cob(I)yrinic acid a,c-diamide adenosyltransferase [Actomonas aquatica]|uniref:corrinoid adenosyltransferase n=1 Tax=Actomonas aquatica TaxID=2866162 RepID=A0ABZ1CDG8_9BACT|nr:cob(I)yrinic acid a,c-diamide adenosyltransferase [Opitutus sp. WL0086]WRQ89727.1 cob(I)yrinic acid a,c-diamide adenosyltransferase [Opitutus sp. WL0086]
MNDNENRKITDPTEHKEAMQDMQESMRAKMRAAKEKKGLIIVNTGNGKGKTTAGFGVVVRTLAHGGKAVVVQFIKSSPDAVAKLLKSDNLTWHATGGGFTWDTQDRDGDIALCEQGWALATAAMDDPEVNLVMMDELNVVLRYDYLPLERVLEKLRTKRPDLHVIITGRDAAPEVVELADLVTEMKEIKHPFAQGVKAQRGIEF